MEEMNIHPTRMERFRSYVMRHQKICIVIGAILLISAGLTIFAVSGQDKQHDVAEDQSLEQEISFEARHTIEFEGFTHFPIDFTQSLSNLRNIEDLTTHILPITSFYDPPHKTVGARKWYLDNPHDGSFYDYDWGVTRSETKLYLVADGTFTTENMAVWLDDYEDPVPIRSADLHTEEVNGDTVYVELDASFEVGNGIHVGYDKFRLRKAIVDETEQNGGTHVFPAGTHIGYGIGSISVIDENVETWPYAPGVNPFDYFTEEKQQELLELYQELYDIYVEEGVHPFTDLTKSDIEINVPGTLEGAWTRNDADYPYHGETSWWEVISFIHKDQTNKETYWRVLDHPWNVENNFMGIFNDDPSVGDAPPEKPLYEGAPLGPKSSFYLLEGDLAAGIAMIIEHKGHDLMETIPPYNDPSDGERRYLRFELHPADDIWDEMLTIQGFATENEARADFTDDALLYRRNPER